MAPRLRLCSLSLLTAIAAGSWALMGNPAQAQSTNANESPGAKGAQIYCFMRNNGNDVQVSWDAAYGLVKRQGNSLFRTSPDHAAVMITEAVVQNPSAYPDCGRYLGDLFRKPAANAGSSSGAGTGHSRNDLGSTKP